MVALTGPNTGGKTATLLTIGLSCVMAKAGMAVPKDPSAAGEAKVAWFDQVLVDVGDSQSLEQSLSTFSGHVKR